MSDREYVKLNTSVQTGSNAKNLLHDDEGNVEAVIELRLPTNIFDSNSGTRQIDTVSMQTSKMRLSLENTPIAQIPIDQDLSTIDNIVSTCQMDVYPYSILNNRTWMPKTAEESSFPYYKSHQWKFIFRFTTNYQNQTSDTPFSNTFALPPITVYGCSDVAGFPKDSPLYSTLSSVLPDFRLHNLSVPSNHERPDVSGDTCLIKNVATLLQMFNDVLESAMTYASIEENHERYIDLISNPGDSVTGYDRDHPIYLDGYDDPFYLLSITPTSTADVETNHLICAVKPTVRLNDQSLSISYDTASFSDKTPVPWNTAFVDTYEFPKQILFTEAERNELWHRPLCKRQYQYGVTDNQTSYSFALANKPGSVMNFIANKATTDTFSFLPWIKIDKAELPKISQWRKFLCTDSVSYDYTEVSTKKVYGFYRNTPDTLIHHDFVEGGLIQENELDPSIMDRYVVAYYNVDENQQRYNVIVDYGARSSGTTETMGPMGLQEEFTDVPGMPDRVSLNTLTHKDIQVHQFFANLPPDTPPIINGEGSSESRTVNGRTTTVFGVIPYVVLSLHFNQSGVPCLYHDQDDRVWVGTDVLSRCWPNAEPNSTESYENETYGTTMRALWRLPSTPLLPTHDPNITYVDGSEMRCIYLNKPVTQTSTFTPVRTTISTGEYSINPIFEPNISGDSFYILDGTGGELSIGEQEPVMVSSNYKYQIEHQRTYTAELSETPGVKSYITGPLDPTRPDLLPKFLMDYNKYEGVTLRGLISEQYRSDSEHPATTIENCVHFYYLTSDDTPWGVFGGIPRAVSDCMIEFGTLVDRTRELLDPYFVATTTDPSDYIEITAPAPTSTYEYSNDPSLTPGSSTTGVSEENIDTLGSPTSSTLKGRAWGRLRCPSIERFRTEWPRTFTYVYNDPECLNTTPGSGPQYEDPQFYTRRSLRWGDEFIWTYLPDDTFNFSIENRGPNFLPWIPMFTGDSEINRYVAAPYEWAESVPGQPNMEIRHHCWPLSTDYADNLITQPNRCLTNVEFTRQVNTVTDTEIVSATEPFYTGNLRLTNTWDNLPIVVMSPISSIVLTLDGMQVNQEFQPVNITQPQGSSLTSSIPVIENFYSLAQTLRDLHDELVVARETFDDAATYTVDTESGKDRVLKFAAKYITKDGKLHQIYIPPNGVFSLQITFGLSYYS